MSLEQALHANTEAVLKNIEVSLRIANLLAGMQLQTSIVTTEILEEVVNTAIAETATEAAPVEETKTSEEATSRTHTYDDVKMALMSVAKVSRAKLQAILDEFGVANISAIDLSDYSRVIELAEKALETADA